MLPSLTSLRFFAALLVVLHHMPGEPFVEGYVGVTFFFILSGFILSHSYAERLGDGSCSASDFWIARVARVYPLHVVTLLLAVPEALAMSEGWAFFRNLVAQLTLTHAAFPASDMLLSLNYPS